MTPQGTVGYLYDSASRLTRLTWPDGLYVTYDYDSLGKVTAVRENGATSGVGVLASYSYDNLGRRTSVTYGNATSRTYAYGAVNRLAGLKIDLAGTNNDLIIGAVGGLGTAIAYNPASQIVAVGRSNDAYAWSGHYDFNRSYTSNGLNQYTTSGTTSLGYDGRGNLATSGGTNYSYNSLNQMISVSGEPVATLAYDPADRLYQLVSGGATTRFLYGGMNVIGEYNGSNALLRRFVPGPGTDEPVVWYEGSGTTNRKWLQADVRGSVIAVSDASGNAIGINSYDEYGIPASTNIGRFQYTGQMWMPEIGMYNYKARMYSPTLGRFMQTDPIGYADGMNLYNYVGGDPINKVDSTGLCMSAFDIEKCSDEAMKAFEAAIYVFAPIPEINIIGNLDSALFKDLNLGLDLRFVDAFAAKAVGQKGRPQSESKACQQLRKDSEDTQSVLPSYVTGNENWNDAATLQGYRNLYQDSFEQYDAVSGPIASTLITAATTAFSFTPWGKGAKMAVGTAAATQGASLSLSALKDSTGAMVEALDARLKVLRAGCN